MRAIRWIALAGGLLLAAASEPPVGPHVTYSCEIPYDATFAVEKDFDRQEAFDIYSWNAFIALNWPAETSTKGEAPCNLQNGVARDCGKPLPHGDYGPTVWETWKPDSSVFRGDASGAIAPSGWNCPLEPLPGCDSLQAKNAAKERQPILRMIVKDGNSAHAFLQAGTFAPLIDQNGSFVRYEMRMNRDEFEFIDAKKLWDSNNHTADVNFQPVGSNKDKTMGPMEIKAAWKVLTDQDNRERFHTRTVEVAWPNKPKTGWVCKQYTMGLVGLHIAHKTQSAPQWVWSTFEQVDNYRGTHPSFTNAACDEAKCPPNVPPKKPQGGWSGDPTVRQTPPTQVVVTPGSAATIPQDSETLNNEVRARLAEMGSVWQYYELVSTQWPSVPYLKDGQPAPVYEKQTLLEQGAGQRPTLLANTTMETYIMGPDAPKQIRNTSSCMACHSVMGKIGKVGHKKSSDFSTLLKQAFPLAANPQLADEQRREMSRLFHVDTSQGGQPTKAIAPQKK